jgi:hypothetical protein
MSKFSIEKPALLIGEGREEELFFCAMVNHLGLSSSIQVTQYGGKNNLQGFLAGLKAQTTFSKLSALGITRDADQDHAAALASVKTAVRKSKLSDTPLHVGTYILPKKDTSGALEALVIEAVSTYPNWSCVEQVMTCVSENDKAQLSPTEMDKRRVHAWLSTLPKPDLRLGEAAQKKFIPFDHVAFNPIIRFIQSLLTAVETRSTTHA